MHLARFLCSIEHGASPHVSGEGGKSLRLIAKIDIIGDRLVFFFHVVVRNARPNCDELICFGKGSGCSKTASITLKMALFAPIPSASVKIAIAVKPGALTSMRSENLRSCISLRAQRLNRINVCSASCREQTGNAYAIDASKIVGADKQRRIVRRNLVQLRR